ncbi:MAG: hypothetical protein WBD20_22975 [Pirellulaceae bacterium]
MAKYYVQSGNIEVVLQADSVEKAALAAVDQSLQSHLWIYDDADLSEADCRDHLMLEALLHMEPSIRVSERGFHRDDAEQIGTPEMIQHWHKLMVGMRRLFVIAGLGNRTMGAVASDQPQTQVSLPRLPR